MINSTGVIHLQKGKQVISFSKYNIHGASHEGKLELRDICRFVNNSLWCLDVFLFLSSLQTGLHDLKQLNQQIKNPTVLDHSGA